MVERHREETVYGNVFYSLGDSYNATRDNRLVSMVGGGNVSLCEAIIRHFLSPSNDDRCSPKPCSIGEVYQPSVTDRKFYSFGLIYKLAKVFGVLNGPGVLDLRSMQNEVRTYCTLVS